MIDLTEGKPALQQPGWDSEQAELVQRQLEASATLVDYDEILAMQDQMREVAERKAFLLQIGHCVELFDYNFEDTRDIVQAGLAMNAILMNAGIRVVKAFRIAGQYGKPRSSDFEEGPGGLLLPSYRGPIVNAPEFTKEARRPDPLRMFQAYQHASDTHGYLRRLRAEGYGDLETIHEWNVRFANESEGHGKERYQRVVEEVARHHKYMEAARLSLDALHSPDIFVSHEALIKEFENGLARQVPGVEDAFYSGSAHMPWAGERTRQADGGHIAFLANVVNPVEVKIGPTATQADIVALQGRLNPNKIPGRLTFIFRMGATAISDALPPLLEVLEDSTVAASDPMHGNTVSHGANGTKTRHFDEVLKELQGFFDTTEEAGIWPGGVHLELTGENVTECLGGSAPHGVTGLEDRYTTECDPRLNPTQGAEVAFLIEDNLSSRA